MIAVESCNDWATPGPWQADVERVVAAATANIGPVSIELPAGSVFTLSDGQRFEGPGVLTVPFDEVAHLPVVS